jgi:hypothetical protein
VIGGTVLFLSLSSLLGPIGAMYAAKAAGKGRAAFFRSGLPVLDRDPDWPAPAGGAAQDPAAAPQDPAAAGSPAG